MDSKLLIISEITKQKIERLKDCTLALFKN